MRMLLFPPVKSVLAATSMVIPNNTLLQIQVSLTIKLLEELDILKHSNCEIQIK